jgi:hypothetical protein
LWLTLAGSGGVHSLVVRWIIDSGAESFRGPVLTPPTIEGLGATPSTWTVDAPSGYQIEAEPRGAISITAGELEFRRAEAEYRLSTLLAAKQRGTPAGSYRAQLLGSQLRLYKHARFAEYQVPAGAPLTDRIAELRQRNSRLASSQAFESIRKQAEEQALSGRASEPPTDKSYGTSLAEETAAEAEGLPFQGTATYWLPSPNEVAPRVVLVAIADAEEARAGRAGIAWLTLLVVILILSFFPRTVARWSILWPEQIAFMGIACWAIFGPNLLAVLLVILGVSMRLLWAGHLFLDLIRGPRPQAGQAATGSSARP